jgi:hypothetical protein
MCIRLNHHIGKRKCEEKKKKDAKLIKMSKIGEKKPSQRFAFPRIMLIYNKRNWLKNNKNGINHRD